MHVSYNVSPVPGEGAPSDQPTLRQHWWEVKWWISTDFRYNITTCWPQGKFIIKVFTQWGSKEYQDPSATIATGLYLYHPLSTIPRRYHLKTPFIHFNGGKWHNFASYVGKTDRKLLLKRRDLTQAIAMKEKVVLGLMIKNETESFDWHTICWVGLANFDWSF